MARHVRNRWLYDAIDTWASYRHAATSDTPLGDHSSEQPYRVLAAAGCNAERLTLLTN